MINFFFTQIERNSRKEDLNSIERMEMNISLRKIKKKCLLILFYLELA
jgi:hypothetical protein